MPAAHQLAGDEKSLTLAAAPSAFGVHLKNPQRHGSTSSAPASARKRSTIDRILLVALDNLGDLVFASALTPPLHRAFPSATIDLWCKCYTAEIGALVPHVRTVVAADPFWAVAPGHRRPPVWPILRSIHAVHANRYDVAVLSEAPWRTAAAVAAARVPVRIGLARHRNAPFLTDVLDAEDVHKPVVREQARLLGALGIEAEDPRYALDAARLTAGAVTAAAAALPSQFVALHPFASTRARCVPIGHWTQLAFALQARGLPVLWIGRTQELDELRLSYTHPRGYYVDQIGDASLAVTAAVLARATAFVGHDSGPLHIAAAFGVPVVGIFAPGQPDRTYPQGPGPWRLIGRPSPAGIDASMMMRELDSLQPLHASR